MTSAASPPRIIRMRQRFEGDGKNIKKTRAFLDEASGGHSIASKC